MKLYWIKRSSKYGYMGKIWPFWENIPLNQRGVLSLECPLKTCLLQQTMHILLPVCPDYYHNGRDQASPVLTDKSYYHNGRDQASPVLTDKSYYHNGRDQASPVFTDKSNNNYNFECIFITTKIYWYMRQMEFCTKHEWLSMKWKYYGQLIAGVLMTPLPERDHGPLGTLIWGNSAGSFHWCPTLTCAWRVENKHKNT